MFGRYMQKLQIQICGDLCGETDLLKLSPFLTLGPHLGKKVERSQEVHQLRKYKFQFTAERRMVHVQVYLNMMQTYQFGHCNTVVIFIFLSLDFVPRQLQ